MEKFGIYIHWPFCLSKCPYCDFASVPCRKPEEDLLLSGYVRDLDNSPHRPVTSIFFGGGTPSMMSFNKRERRKLRGKDFNKNTNGLWLFS